jgi:hypothetical protein
MTSLILSWIAAVVVICYWVYGATMNGTDLHDEQVALRTRTVS